jgi:hypothetical protein
MGAFESDPRFYDLSIVCLGLQEIAFWKAPMRHPTHEDKPNRIVSHNL